MRKEMLTLCLLTGMTLAQSRWTLVPRWDTTDPDNIYIGKAAVDNPNNPVDESAARWQIKLISTNGIFYARTATNVNDGVSFNKVWTNRAAYTFTDME